MLRRFCLAFAIVAGILAAGTGSGHATMSYTCYFEATNAGLLSGTHVKISANSKAEAEQLAIAKIKEVRGKDTVIKSLRCE